MKKNITLALAISAALAVPNIANSAITLTQAGSSSPLKLAKEVAVQTSGTNFQILGTTGNLEFIPPTGVSITPTNPAYVKVNLVNGAKFLKSPKILCKYSGNAFNSGALTVGGQGFNAATYQLANGVMSGASGCIVSDYSGIAVSGQQNQSVSATFEFFDAGIASSKTYKGQLVTFNRALSPKFTAPTESVVIDVSKSSKEFIPTTNTVKAKTAYLGAIAFNEVTTPAPASVDGNPLAVNGTTFSSAAVSISGALVAAIGTGATGNAFYLTRTAATNKCTGVGTIATGQVSGNVVTFNNALDATEADGGVNVCVTVNGTTTSLEKGQITGSLTAAAKTGYSFDSSADNKNLAPVDKNGSSAKVLIVPKTTAPDGLFVRIYNISNVPGKILGTLYSQGSTDGLNTGAGQVLGTGTLVASLAPNAVTILKQADIATALGIVNAWPGRAWLQVDAEFEGLRVMSLIRSPSGVLTNFSDSACTTPTECGD